MQWWRFACPVCGEGSVGYTIREAKENDPRELVWNPETFLLHGDGVTKTQLFDDVLCGSCGALVDFRQMRPWHVVQCDVDQSRQLTANLEKVNGNA